MQGEVAGDLSPKEADGVALHNQAHRPRAFRKNDLPRGVTIVSTKGGVRYHARYKRKHLGAFATPEDAFAAYRQAFSQCPIRKNPVKILVDPDIAEAISSVGWVCVSGYAATSMKPRSFLHLTAWLLYGGVNPSPGQMLDHINGDRMDNRRCNLRLLTIRGNAINRSTSKNVCKDGSRWMVYFDIDGQKVRNMYEEEEIARLVAKHMRDKFIEREVICYAV